MFYHILNSLYQIWQSSVLIDYTIKITNIDKKDAVIRWINGKDGISGKFDIKSQETILFPFYGTSMRLWAEYHDYQPQTLLEWTRQYGKEHQSVIDISLVDGIGASFNLLGQNVNITADFNSNVCDDAGSPYFNNGCISPCLRSRNDIHCCSGYYNSPYHCYKDYAMTKWCNAIKRASNSPRVYCYAYDDKDGTISNFGNGIHIIYWDNANFKVANI